MRQITYWPGLGKSHFHHQLGLVTQLMYDNATYRRYPLAALKMWIEPALRHRQIGFFFNEFNVAVAYITWALLADDVSERWKSSEAPVFHESEWNEGTELWIMDFVCAKDWVSPVCRKIRSDLFQSHDSGFSLRRLPDGRVKKISAWRRLERVMNFEGSRRHCRA